MNYKIENTLKKSKNVLIVIVVLWILLSIVLVSPITVSIVEAKDFGEFIENMFSAITDVGNNLGKIFNPQYMSTFWRVEGYFTIILLFFGAVGFVKSMPKNEYTDIEHGSSDWASGEQYSVLSKKKGILLAENHYLPVDKRGNTNVLVVGRIRFTVNLHHMLFRMPISF